jgi:RNA polymerase sigma-70 factor (sigma-E family)
MRRHWGRGRLAAEDEAEFAAFVARDGGRLLRFAVLLTGERCDAEDLVQVVLLRSAIHWPAARRCPEAYARTVLVNLARDRWRLHRRRPSMSRWDDLDAAPPAVNATDRTDRVLDQQMLLDACRSLPVRQRAVLVLRFWEDRSVEETAAVLGCSPGTVKTHAHRALARLRGVLEASPAEPDATDAVHQARPERKDASC